MTEHVSRPFAFNPRENTFTIQEACPLRASEHYFSEECCFYDRSFIQNNTATVVIPFDVAGDPSTISKVLHQLNTATICEKFEVVLGVGRSLSPDSSKVGHDYQMYSDLVKHLRDQQKKMFSSVRLRTTLTGVEHNTLDKIWDTVLHRVIDESIAFRRDPQYPIIRLDPSSKSMCREMVGIITKAVRNNEAHLVKAPTSFAYRYGHTENTIEDGLDSLDPAERQAANMTLIYALTKDIIESQLKDTEERTTYQETGSGAQLINWIRVLTIARQEKVEPLSEASKNSVFLHIARTALDTAITPLHYARPRHARLYLSHQHLKELAMTVPPWHLPLLAKELETGAYKQPDATPQFQRWTQQDVTAMIGIMFLRQEIACGRRITIPPSTQATLAQAVEDGGFEHDEQPLTFDHSWLDEAKQLGTFYLKTL